jgi:hypothetical protein
VRHVYINIVHVNWNINYAKINIQIKFKIIVLQILTFLHVSRQNSKKSHVLSRDSLITREND